MAMHLSPSKARAIIRGIGSVVDVTGATRTYVSTPRRYPLEPSAEAAVRQIWREMGDDMRASVSAYEQAHGSHQ